LKIRIAYLFRYVFAREQDVLYGSHECVTWCFRCGVNEVFFSLLDIAQRWFVVTDVSGQPIGPVFLAPWS